MAGIRRLEHVALIVDDLERSRAFYVDGLGLEPMERPAFSFDGLWFRAGATSVHLIHKSAGNAPVGLPDPPKGVGGRAGHFAFETDDCLEAKKTLEARGVPIFHGPQQRPDGATQIYVIDPDNHIIELFSMPK